MSKIISWNVNSLNKRGEQVLQLLDEESPDVMMMQETRGVSFPDIIEAANRMGYIFYANESVGGRAGVMTFIKVNMDELHQHWVDDVMADLCESRLLIVKDDSSRKAYVNVYINQGVEPLHNQYALKLALMRYLTERILILEMDYEVIVAGDFNITANDEGVWSTKHWTCDTICCTPAERDVFDNMMHMTRLVNSVHKDGEIPATWFGYRTQWRNIKECGWTKYWLKIDHILGPKAATCQSLMRYRLMGSPSDHVPLMVIT